MKIISAPYSPKHGSKALGRIHKMIIRGTITWTKLHELYGAMLHLERYVERLTTQNSHAGQKRSRKSK
ncbi:MULTISPECIES: hypothetical protein [unclassified Acinetobacter]|uniref:hypothetical protein n=1 Tax=unclassified Acinetobacter TaxID=196816 RepID=UPI0015D25559|nr:MULTISPECIES: hypothetical protein [unclassified Acinetobacter]